MSNRILTISREFGSGGRTIGKEIAKQLGIPCYDSELIDKIAVQSGFARDYVREKDKRRAAYHRFYTDRKWGDAKNYQVCLDSGVLGIDRCVQILRMLY